MVQPLDSPCFVGLLEAAQRKAAAIADGGVPNDLKEEVVNANAALSNFLSTDMPAFKKLLKMQAVQKQILTFISYVSLDNHL